MAFVPNNHNNAATMSNNNNNNNQNNTIAFLQKKCRELEQSLEEKDEAMFELSATLVTVQAEAQHSVKEVEQKFSAETQRYKESLRRTEREATLLHHQLQQQQQQQQQQAAPVVATNAAAAAPAAAPTAPPTVSTTSNNTTPTSTRSSSLALHLLQSHSTTTTSDDAHHTVVPPQVVLAAVNNSTTNNTDNDLSLVWQLTEHCLLTNQDWSWWKRAVEHSAMARSMIRSLIVGASTTTTPTRLKRKRATSSRIVLSSNNNNMSQQALQDLENSMRESLGSGVETTTSTPTASSSPYLQDLHQRLFAKLTSSCNHLDLVQVLLMDATPEECWIVAWKPLCATLESPILRLLLHYYGKTAFGSAETTNTLAGLRLDYNNDNTTSTITTKHVGDVDESTIVLALAILRQCWSTTTTTTTTTNEEFDDEWCRTVIKLLLDFLEYVVLPNPHHQHCVDLGCAILQVLQQWCAVTKNGVALLTTTFGLPFQEKKWACSGIGVVCRLLSSQTCVAFGENKRIVVECLCLLNLVLWQTRRQREQCENSKQEPISYSSLLTEYSELHKAACNAIVVGDEFPPTVQTMAAMQLYELHLDEEDLEEFRREVVAASTTK